MNPVEFLAILAEIVGGVAVVLGISFGFLEFRRSKATILGEAAAACPIAG